jgi:hypothetical protein
VQTTAITQSLLAAVAYAILAVAGLVLWNRVRSVATALVAIGFAIILIDQIILSAGSVCMIASFRSQSSDNTLFVIYHRAHSPQVVLAGLWFAAVGLVWHAVRATRR